MPATRPAQIHVSIGRIVVDGMPGLDVHAVRTLVHDAVVRSLRSAGTTEALAAGSDALTRHCRTQLGEAIGAALREAARPEGSA